jgi:hypothetical protein
MTKQSAKDAELQADVARAVRSEVKAAKASLEPNPFADDNVWAPLAEDTPPDLTEGGRAFETIGRGVDMLLDQHIDRIIELVKLFRGHS